MYVTHTLIGLCVLSTRTNTYIQHRRVCTCVRVCLCMCYMYEVINILKDVHAKPPCFQPRRFMTFFFEVLLIFWHQVCENQTSCYGVTWPFGTRDQPEKWDWFSFCVQNKWQSEFFYILACKSVIFPYVCFEYHLFNLILSTNYISWHWKESLCWPQ